MNRPEDIPEDIRSVASTVWMDALLDGTPDAALIIARAILAERERCTRAAHNAILRMTPEDRANGDLCDDAVFLAIRKGAP